MNRKKQRELPACLLKLRVVLNSAILTDVTPCKLCAGIPHSSGVGEVATRHGEPTDALYSRLASCCGDKDFMQLHGLLWWRSLYVGTCTRPNFELKCFV